MFVLGIQAANDVGFGPKIPVFSVTQVTKVSEVYRKTYSNIASKYEQACVSYKYKLLMMLALDPKPRGFFGYSDHKSE